MNWYSEIKTALLDDKRWEPLPDETNIGPDIYRKAFKINNITYIFQAGASLKDEKWWIIFWEENQDKTRNFYPTNRRQSLQVISGVMDCFISFLDMKQPKYFCFSAAKNEPSRISLYRSMMKRYAEELGYGHYERDGNTIYGRKFDKNVPTTHFEAYRKNDDGSEPPHAPTAQELAGTPRVPDEYADPLWKQVKNKITAKPGQYIHEKIHGY